MTESNANSDASPEQPPAGAPEQPPASAPDQPPATASPPISRGLMFNVVVPLLLLVAGAAVVVAFGSAEAPKRPPADLTRTGRLRALPPVRVEKLQSLESTGQRLRLQVDGSVVPYREALVAAEVSGRVIEKSDDCEAGSYVKENQLLMKIDATDYELEIQRLTRLQEQEYQALREVDQEMTNAMRLIDVARKDIELQQKELDRQNALPAGFASRAEIDQAERAVLAATQQLVTVENQLALLQKRRVRLESSERLAATQLKAAEVNLQRTEIRAPIDGVIVREDADLNTFVSRGTVLVTIEDTSKVEVATNLRMDQLYWVLDQKGGDVSSSTRAYELPETPAIIEYEMTGRDDQVFRWKGTLRSYDGIGLDAATRTVPVRVVVDNPRQYVDQDGEESDIIPKTALVRGMYVRVKLLIQPQTNLVVIPARALQPGNRVLQFLPDESVLQRPGDSEDSVLADQAGEALQVDHGSFDPTEWLPGRVEIRESVNPVDSLRVDDGQRADANSPASIFSTANRMWVCEARDTALDSESFVVVSPIGSIDDGQFPVRAQINKGRRDDRMTADRSRATQPAPESKQTTARAESVRTGEAS